MFDHIPKLDIVGSESAQHSCTFCKYQVWRCVHVQIMPMFMSFHFVVTQNLYLPGLSVMHWEETANIASK